MKFTRLHIHNINSFPSQTNIEFSPTINVFIGENNAGKSTILKCLHYLQAETLDNRNALIGTPAQSARFDLHFEGKHEPQIPHHSNPSFIQANINNKTMTVVRQNAGSIGLQKFSHHEPGNLIYPYLSKRKTVKYEETINQGNANSVTGDVRNLYAKIDRLYSTKHRAQGEYIAACKDILGFEISTFQTPGGKQAVYYLENEENDDLIPLNQMGEGVSNILGMITDLCVGKDKVFLIEEPENDLHPKALKALLELILKKSDLNQFFISTHSNIVMRVLGSDQRTNVIEVVSEKTDPKQPNLYLSRAKLIDSNEERQRVLADLGYEFSDLGLWKAWLFLEESSAERIIRDYLIPMFARSLIGKLRTFSATSLSEVEVKFRDFNRLFVFTHLEESYKNNVWVYVDDGEEEKNIIQKLKDTYCNSGWQEEQFCQFSEHNFESYYPEEFNDDRTVLEKIQDKEEKRIFKNELLLKLVEWADNNPVEANSQFKESAKEVIQALKKIEKTISS